MHPAAAPLANHKLAIVPVAHGEDRPDPDSPDRHRRQTGMSHVSHWLELGSGIGAICGAASRNLVALEFTEREAFMAWSAANAGLAARLPIVARSCAIYVLVRIPYTVATADFFLPNFQGPAGRVLGDCDILPLPPTRDSSGKQRVWMTGLRPNNLPTLLSLQQVGVDLAPSPYGHQQPAIEQSKTDQSPESSESYESSESSNPPILSPSNPPVLQSSNPRPLQSSSPPPTGPYGSFFQAADDYRERPDCTETRWIVEGLIPETYLVVLAGDSKAGKSSLLTAMGLAVARGEPFLGMRTEQGSVLWIAYEESPPERRAVLDAFPQPHGPFYITHEKLLIDTRDGLDAIRWWVRKTGAKLVVVDPLYAATRAESLADGRTARSCLSGLKDLCRTESCAAVVLHHFNKDTSSGMSRDRFADSHQIVAAASMDILMDSKILQSSPTVNGRSSIVNPAVSSPIVNGQSSIVNPAVSSNPPILQPSRREITLRCRGRGDFANQTWLIRSSGVADYQLVDHGAKIQAAAIHRDQLIIEAVASATKPVTAKDIANMTSISLKTLQNQLHNLADSNAISLVAKEGNTCLYGPAQER